MEPKAVQQEIGRLQQQLSQALAAKDKDAEIASLLGIGDAALDSAPGLAFGHYKLAEKVIRNSGNLERLHEAIGGQGVALRRDAKFDEAIEKYSAAEKAAGEALDKVAQVRWMLRRASVHRARDELDQSVAVVDAAHVLLRPKPAVDEVSMFRFLGPVNFGDARAVGTLAELEGQIGLNLQRQNDEQGAEDHYRSACYFAVAAQDQPAIGIWSTNLGNACSRAGRYEEALKYYDRALTAARKCGDSPRLLATAGQFAVCMNSAFRHQEGGDRLRALEKEQSDDRTRLTLLDHALDLYDQGACAKQAIDTTDAIQSIVAGKSGVREDYLERVNSVREKYQAFLAQGPASKDGPPVLDLWLPEFMDRAVKQGDATRALEQARLVCDVRLAVALRGEKQWKRLVNGDLIRTAALDLRVVFDTLRLLIDAGRADDSVELLQRFKAPAFCVPELLRQESNPAAPAQVAAYVKAVLALRDVLDGLAAPAPLDLARPINDIRRASERMREAGEALREFDPIMLARLGGTMRRDELIDALPYRGGVGIVDYLVGPTGTHGIALSRDADGVVIAPVISPNFTAAHARQLFDLYREANIPQQLGGAQSEALAKIGKLLHDRLFCGLSRALATRGITQLILIPDLLTRNLPLHLARVCGKEFEIPGIDTKDAEYLCEVMPIEYAPCLQAVAASQLFMRPRQIRRIAAFADPQGDLPGMRASMEQLGKQAPSQSAFRVATGAKVTRKAVEAALPIADVMIFGTHGKFSPGSLDQTGLILSGETWTASDMAKMPDLKKRALLLLVACEAGAVGATPDDRNAWGVPGALLSAGASGVLANLWPVETLTSSYLLDRFLKYLGHRGYRPAAALFRAVRDLRRMKRAEALKFCKQALARYEKAKAPPSVLTSARNLLYWIEDNKIERPFADPYFWGASTIFGSGWHLPAGATVGDPLTSIENMMRLDNAEGMLRDWKAAEAYETARDVAARSDGSTRGHACTTMAWARMIGADLGNRQRARIEARRLLHAAERIAKGEEDRKLLKRVQWMRERMEKDYVVENDD